jgi:hypothetical protein
MDRAARLIESYLAAVTGRDRVLSVVVAHFHMKDLTGSSRPQVKADWMWRK